MNWIKVAVGISRDESVLAIADRLGVSVPTTTGYVVLVYTALAEGCVSGNLSNTTDSTIERWAQWNGKRGKFAEAFRAELCTPEGLVRSWEKYNGGALRELERDRERKKAERAAEKARKQSDGRPSDDSRTSDQCPPLEEKRGEERREELPSHSSSDGEEGRWSLAFASIAPCVAPVGHDALRELLRHVQQPETWAGIIRGCASGQSMPEARPASAERIAAAVQDFVAGGHHRDPKALTKLFRGYISNAKASPAQTRHLLNVDDDRAEQLRLLREQNQRRAMRHDALKPEPTWAKEIDAKYPDGRTWPGGVAA